MELAINVLKLYREQCEGVLFQNIVPQYYNIFKSKSPTQNELLYAVCLFSETLENCSLNIFN